ncbi:expressed unknown protein [Seminavis robusta]|uniref:Uncharacterized protein n=1 Tax=Seminavis robusta TaxID=568900 RepID=A0A9N8H390_9STRA|nr:expressed unknown protein [Seminavis robusta]|eukprot:Sro33_g021570.1 n/a (165) ;mRNA; r:107992-108486
MSTNSRPGIRLVDEMELLSDSHHSNGSSYAYGRRRSSRRSSASDFQDMGKLERALHATTSTCSTSGTTDESDADVSTRRRRKSGRTASSSSRNHQRSSNTRRSRVSPDLDASASESMEQDQETQDGSAKESTGRTSKKGVYRSRSRAATDQNWAIFREALGNMA